MEVAADGQVHRLVFGAMLLKPLAELVNVSRHFVLVLPKSFDSLLG